MLVRQQKKNSLTSRYSTNSYIVTEIKGSRVTAQNRKHKITRNKSFFKVFKGAAHVKGSEDSESEDEFNEQNNEQNQEEEQPQFRYPARIRMMTNFYGAVVLSTYHVQYNHIIFVLFYLCFIPRRDIQKKGRYVIL